jgi:hypothetical protein
MEGRGELKEPGAQSRAPQIPCGDAESEAKNRPAKAHRHKRPRELDRRPSPLAAGFAGVVGGFLAGAAFAIGTSGQLFLVGFPEWVWHLFAGTYGLALGLAGAFRYRGWALKTLSFLAPPAVAVAASYVLFRENSAQAGGPQYAWLGTMVALTGAVTGLLAGFSSRSLGGFAAGIIGGQLIAWPASFVFINVLNARMPYGVVIPAAFAAASGLTHLAIAYALRWTRADLVPIKNMAKAGDR